MSMKPLLFGMLSLFLIFVFGQGGCNAPILHPAVGPGTSYPCGVSGVVCLTEEGKESGWCCWEGSTCGGPIHSRFYVGCPEGECCDIGPSNDQIGAKKPKSYKMFRSEWVTRSVTPSTEVPSGYKPQE